MIEYNQLFYSIFAFMAFGQGLSSYIGFKDHDTYFKTQVFWSVSIYLFMFSCVFWAIAPVTNLFCLTLANSCLVGSMLSTLLLFRSFTQAFTKYHLSNALLVLIFYGVVFEFIRQGDYIPRFLLTSSTLTIICVLQIKKGNRVSITKLFNKKKHVKGIPDKVRTRAEVDQDYHHHAVMYGHISRIMKQDSVTMDKNQELLDQHLENRRHE